MKRIACLVFIAVFACSSPVRAQVSVEEAEARLAARRAQAATQPSVAQYVAENAKLRAEIETLKKEIEKLKASNSYLQSALAKTAEAPAAAKPKKKFSADFKDDLKPGMTEEEVDEVMSAVTPIGNEKPFKQVLALSAESKTIAWYIFGQPVRGNAGNIIRPGARITLCIVTLVNGKASNFEF